MGKLFTVLILLYDVKIKFFNYNLALKPFFMIVI